MTINLTPDPDAIAAAIITRGALHPRPRPDRRSPGRRFGRALREADAAAIAAAAIEETLLRIRMERELGIGLARRCGGCGTWVALADCPGDAPLCPPCRTDFEGRN